MRIAILGTRGIPARYGGFETFAEELSSRLVERGHQVAVYCRQRFEKPVYRGVSLVYLPTIRHKYFDTIAHTFLSTLHLLFHRRDVALYCNGANAVFTVLPRMAGIRVALNVDGLERQRKKWNRVARTWYHWSERLSTILPDAMIADARMIAEYYQRHYAKHSEFIPYGAAVGKVTADDTLGRLGLESGKYFLYVSRMEPENNALLVRESFEKIAAPLKLALVGDAPYAPEYIDRVRATSDPRVVLPGAIYGDGYHQLQSHCFAYIHATEVGGTHPALIEAMGRGAVVLYLNTPENAEVAGGAALPFERGNLAAQLERVAAMPEAERSEWSRRAMERVAERYSWDAVTDQYETLFRRLCAR